jgi:hypothetical protein
MEVLPLDQQKKAILFAPKELLWKIVEDEQAWVSLFRALPDEYYSQFLALCRRNHVKDPGKIRSFAQSYVKNKVRYDHLQKAVTDSWNPENLEEATSWLKENGFLNRPLMPLNLAAMVREAATTPRATRERLARAANNESPKLGRPPEGASPEGTKAWNRVMRDKKRRKMILKPKSVGDQWALAMKFWLSECAEKCAPAYKSNSSGSSTSHHGKSTVQRAIRELASGLAYDGYTMSRPASRAYKTLWEQLKADGYDLGEWSPLKPKRRVK